MKKSLIALAVAGVIAAPAAMAEVTIYGQARASFDSHDNGAGGTTATKVTDDASRIGFKGSEDLGGGTSAFFQIETGVALDAGGGAWATRDSWVGLTGESWGTVQLGHGDAPSKVVTKGLDLFGDTQGNDQLLSYDPAGNSTAPGGVAVYASPNMSGFQVIAAYLTAAEAASTSGAKKDSHYNLGASYTGGPLYVGLGYDSQKNDTSGVSYSETTLGASYTFDALWASLTYQRLSSSNSAANRNLYAINGKYSFGSDAVKLQYSRAGDLNSAANTGSNEVSVGYDHGMSKNTTVYALYSRIANDSSAGYSYNGNGGNPLVGNGADPSVWSIGINHSF